MSTKRKMDTKKFKLIIVHTATKDSLDNAKLVSCESYNSIIERALEALKEKEQKSK